MKGFKNWITAIFCLDLIQTEVDLAEAQINLLVEITELQEIVIIKNMKAIEQLNANLDTLSRRLDAALPTLGGVPEADVQAAADRAQVLADKLPQAPLTETPPTP